MTRLKLALLGTPRIELDGEPINVDTRKAIALLAYLAVSGRRHGRESLIALFWPESDRTHGRSALRRTLSPLNGALEGRWLKADNETIALAPDADLAFDVEQFHSRITCWRTHQHARGQPCDECLAALAEVVSLYRDDFMAGFTLADSPEFDNWQTYQRERLRRELADALERLVQGHAARRQFGQALAYAHRWLALDPLHEPAQRQLMLLYVWSGDRAAALRQYEACVRLLDAELGVPPMEETRQLYCAIGENQAPPPPAPPPPALPVAGRSRQAIGQGGEITAPHARPTLPDHLPARLTSFVGREEDVIAVARLLGQARLVTLTGPGGCGKTSLAVETARWMAEANGVPVGASGDAATACRFDDVRVVELLPLADPTLLAQTILTALGLEGNPEEHAQQVLARLLGPKRVLLILDNCEHLIDAVAHLVEALLRSCPGLCVLATSRERLHIGAETVYPVPPLGLPDAQAALDLESVALYPAVQLFSERSRAITPSFRLTAANMPAVVRICSLLDGIPLALELGAAATASFSVEEIAEQLDARMLLAGSGYRTADPRHHSLHDTVEWSYRLLAPAEQRVLVHLAVFVGGWTLAAMESVAGGEATAATLLQQLVRKSLIGVEQMRQQEGGRTRYYLLRAIREYAALLLSVDPEQELVRRRHFHYYAQLATRAGDQVMGAQHHRAMAELDADYHNIRAAVQFSLERPDLAEGRLRMAAALTYYWRLRSHTLRAEGLAWLEPASEPHEVCSPAAQALACAALLSLGCIDPLHSALSVGAEWHGIRRLIAAGEALLEQSWLIESDKRSAGRLLLALADAHRFPAGLHKCREYAGRAVGLLQAAGDRRGLGFAHNMLNWLDVMEGDTPAVQARQEANLRISQESGSAWALCEAYRAQATLAGAANDPSNQIHYIKLLIALAEQEEFLPFLYDSFHRLERIDEGLAIGMAEALVERQRHKGNSVVLGLALHQLGRIYVNVQQFERAASLLDEAIDFWRRRAGEQGQTSALQWSLVDRGNAAYFLVQYATALRCFEESLSLFAVVPFSDGSAWPHFYRGYTWLAKDELSNAKEDFRQCIQIVTAGYIGWRKLLIRSCAGLAEIAWRRAEIGLSGKLFAAAATLDAAALEPAARGRFGEVQAFVCTMAATPEYRRDPVFAQGWQEGERLTLEEAIALALG
jgi:predicted ATPase/DNA-binding SARP family transcriptional activator